MNGELYLPEDWFTPEMAELRKKLGIPDAVDLLEGYVPSFKFASLEITDLEDDLIEVCGREGKAND